MRLLRSVVAFSVLSVFAVSCGKQTNGGFADSGVDEGWPPTAPSDIDFSPLVHKGVYAVGSIYDPEETSVAFYWKDGERNKLSTISSTAYDLFIDDSFVYVTGTIEDGESGKTVYWKNDHEVELSTEGKAFPNSIFVDDNGDVYVAGSDSGRACYWKNGDKIPLQEESNEAWSSAASIIVKDDDIYIAGRYAWSGNYSASRACVWHNGTKTDLSAFYSFSEATDVFLHDGRVFVSGTVQTEPCYWEDGELTILEKGDAQSAVGRSIAVAGDDVYVSGEYRTEGASFYPLDSGDAGPGDDSEQFATDVACYWKNGDRIDLADGETSSSAHGVVISEGDVYIAGGVTDSEGDHIACYWKNGEQMDLSTPLPIMASAKSIVVVR